MDQLIHEKETEVTQVRDMVIQRVDRVELLLKQMAKLLASNTNYATLISGPQYHQTKIKFIQLSRVEAGETPYCHCFRRQHYQELDCGTRCGAGLMRTS